MRVHRQVIRGQRTGVLEKVTSHPVVFVRSGNVSDLLPEISPVERRATGARGTHVGDRKTLIVRHGYQSSLAVARVPLNPDLFRVHRFVGLEVIQGTTGTPS